MDQEQIDNQLSLEPVHAESDFGPTPPTSKAAYDQAKRENLVVVLPADREIQIDIDSEEAYKYFQKQLELFEQYFDFEKIVTTWSKSGPPRRHITLTLPVPAPNAVERICLQALLGSDRKRELLSLIAYKHGENTPTLFLEKADEYRHRNRVGGIVASNSDLAGRSVDAGLFNQD